MAWDDLMILKAPGVAITADTSHTAIDLGPPPGGFGGDVPNKGQLIEVRLWVTDLAVDGTDETYHFIIEESADDSTFREIGTFRLLIDGDEADLGTGKQYARYVLVRQRYLRLRLDGSGTSFSIEYSCRARGIDAVVTDTERLSY